MISLVSWPQKYEKPWKSGSHFDIFRGNRTKKCPPANESHAKALSREGFILRERIGCHQRFVFVETQNFASLLIPAKPQ